MKYKKQLVTGMFALTLLASGVSAFAADIPTTNQTKTVSNISHYAIVDAKDKSGKDLETKDDMVKKVKRVKHAKSMKTHKVKTTATVVKPSL